MEWNGKSTIISWTENINNNILESILKRRNSTILQSRPPQLLSKLSVPTAADKFDTVINRLDGISCSDATTLQKALDVSDEHPFT